MDRNELTLAIAGALVGAFLLGWILRWFFGRMNGSGPRSPDRVAEIASELHRAEEARRRAEKQLAEMEGAAAHRIAELEAELTSAHADLSRAEAEAEEVRSAYREVLASREPQ
jgi:hypothetical protein